MTPEEEIQVTPARTTAATGPQPSSSAASRRRAAALRTKSTSPAGYWVLRLETRSLARVLQAEHEQQQDDADLGADRDELLARAQRQQPALAEGEPGQQIQGDRGELEAARRTGRAGPRARMIAPNSIRKTRGVHGGHSRPSIAAAASTPSRVPITMSVSPPASRKSGRGRGDRLRPPQHGHDRRAGLGPHPGLAQHAPVPVRGARPARSARRPAPGRWCDSRFGLWWAGHQRVDQRGRSPAPVRCSDWAQASGSSAR